MGTKGLFNLLRLPVWVGIFLITFMSVSKGRGGNAMAYIETAPGEAIWVQGDTAAVAIGDTVTFQIRVNASTESIFAWQFLLTIDDYVFRPVLKYWGLDGDGNEIWQPFTSGSAMATNPSTNRFYAGDSLDGSDVNGIPGYQLAYGQVLTAGIGVSGSNLIAATFDLVIMDWPLEGSSISVIRFDGTPLWDNLFIRPNEPAIEVSFNQLNSLNALISGVKIYPPLPDTLLVPGTNLDIWMGEHLSSGLFDSTDVTWSYTNLVLPTGATFDLSQVGNTYRLSLTTNDSTHDILNALIRVDTPDPLYWDEQLFTVVIDYVPVFDRPLTTFAFDEDTQLVIATDSLFTDQDDTGADLQGV